MAAPDADVASRKHPLFEVIAEMSVYLREADQAGGSILRLPVLKLVAWINRLERMLDDGLESPVTKDDDGSLRREMASAAYDRLVEVGPKVCFCCPHCIKQAITILSKAGIELRLIDGHEVTTQSAEPIQWTSWRTYYRKCSRCSAVVPFVKIDMRNHERWHARSDGDGDGA